LQSDYKAFRAKCRRRRLHAAECERSRAGHRRVGHLSPGLGFRPI